MEKKDCKRIKCNLNLGFTKMKPLPRLKLRDKEARLQFCRSNMVKNWKDTSSIFYFLHELTTKKKVIN